MGRGEAVVRVSVIEDARVAGAVARDLAVRAGFGRAAAAGVAIAASELASNVVRHAAGGVLRLAVRGDEIVLESEDDGLRGASVRSRGRGLGHGLGAVERLMDGLEIHERPSGGRAVRAWLRRRA